MGIFDDVVVNAKSAAQTVGKMAGQFVDMSKLRINMAELNGEITKRYQELGRFIYEAKTVSYTHLTLPTNSLV